MKDIFKAINSKIKETFPNVVIQSTDISEGFQRPCFYVDFENFRGAAEGGTIKSEKMDIEIHYFPSDRYKYKIEMLEVLRKLENAFIGTLKINDKVKINILDTEAKKTDGVLIFTFETEIFDSMPGELHPSGDEYKEIEQVEIGMEA